MRNPNPSNEPPTTPLRSSSEQGSLTYRALVANLRHELRTPINAILGYSEMLIEDAHNQGDTLEAFHTDLQNVHTAGEQLLEIVNSVLDASKIESGQLNYDPEVLGATLRHRLRAPIDAIMGYTEMLFEDAPSAGSSGILLDVQKIHEAVNRFLALINDIASFSRAQLGESPADYRVVGQAALLDDVITTIKSLERQQAELVQTSQGGALLIVDDNEVNRDVLSRSLQRQGHTTAMAENGIQALQMLHSQKFDLVLLDIMMPEMNGYQVLQEIKSTSSLRDLPVIMISALDELDSVVRCIEMGAEEFLPKPFNPVILRARIGACLEKKRLRDREKAYLEQLRIEREKSERLLLNILPKAIADRLKETTRTIAENYEAVTVLFADLVEFTEFSRGISPETLVSLLNDIFSSFDQLADQHHLEKIKTIGDCYMVVGGLPTPRPDHTLAITNMALDMINALERFNAEHGTALTVRVGIHTGPVVAGIIGTRKFIYDLWGDTVNVASRMEAHGIAGRIQVTPEVFTALQDHFTFEERGIIPLKGKLEMMTYLLTGRKQ